MPGTPKVGYMQPVPGGFRCGNCKHYKIKDDGSGCNQKEVVEELGKGKNGLAPVDDSGCCNEFDPKPAETLGGKFVELASKGRK